MSITDWMLLAVIILMMIAFAERIALVIGGILLLLFVAIVQICEVFFGNRRRG